MTRVIPLIRALVALCLGFLVSILILESLLHLNPQLLFRGMAVPFPVEPPLTHQTYDVRYSDADVFTWRPDLVKPIPPGEDQVEAHVVFETDEFGFRNQPPTPEKVDIVVLGRSISMAAHLPQAWPKILQENTSQKILNLADPGGNLALKKVQLNIFGLPHRPKWIVVEITPSIDFRGSQDISTIIFTQAITPALQGILRNISWIKDTRNPRSPIYPLLLTLPNRVTDITCCLHYMEFFTLDAQTLENSTDWIMYRSQLMEIVDIAKNNQACVALLIAPTKPDIYFPLAQDPDQLKPIINHTISLAIGGDGYLVTDPDRHIKIETIIENIYAGRDVIRKFAHENNIPIVDPTDLMITAVLEGNDPFMVYDSHWNAMGHKLVAHSVNELITRTSCP